MTQPVWLFLYLFQHLVIGFGFGSLLYSVKFPVHIDKSVRFVIGMCLTPFVMSYSVSLLGYILPGGNLFWYRYFPLMIGLILSIIFGKNIIRDLHNKPKKKKKRSSFDYRLSMILAIILLINLVLTAINLKPLYEEPIKERDALVYLNEALAFVNDRNSHNAIIGIKDHPDGSIIGNYHGFAFNAYLSHALIFSNNPGPGDDLVVRFAFHILFIYGLAALIALGKVCYNLNVGLLASLLLFFVNRYSTILTKFSRDFFRIIPFIILVILLLKIDDTYLEKKSHKNDMSLYLLLLVFTILSVISHSVGVIFVICIAFVWFMVRSWRKKALQKKITVLMILSAGTIIGGFRFVEVIIFKDEMNYNEQYFNSSSEATEVYSEEQGLNDPSFESYMNLSIDERYEKYKSMNLYQLVIEILQRDKYCISLPSIILLGSLIIKMFHHQDTPLIKRQLFIGLVFVSCYLPLTGVFDISVFSIRQLYLVNSRYLTHAYPFGAVMIASALINSIEISQNVNGKEMKSDEKII